MRNEYKEMRWLINSRFTRYHSFLLAKVILKWEFTHFIITKAKTYLPDF